MVARTEFLLNWRLPRYETSTRKRFATTKKRVELGDAMSTFPDGSELGRNDVVGRTLVEILQTPLVTEREIDWVYTFFRLDSGASFCLPFDDAGRFCVEEPSAECTPQDYPDLRPVLGQRVTAVLRRGPDSGICHDSPYLIMENGYVITDVMGDYHGLASAGVYVYAPSEIDTSSMVDFFP